VYNFEKHAGKALHGLLSTVRKTRWTWHTISPCALSRVEVSEDCLSFFKADGTLAAFFDKSAVRSLARDERIRTSGQTEQRLTCPVELAAVIGKLEFSA